MLKFLRKKEQIVSPGWQYFMRNSDKYTSIFHQIENSCSDCYDTQENIVWQMWWQGVDSIPTLVRKCMDTCDRNLPNNYQRIVITQNNYSDYLTIPEGMMTKFRDGKISITHLSDYIRVSLLLSSGGIWADATLFFSSPIPQDVLKSRLFYFQSPSWLLGIDSLSLDNAIAYASLPSSIGTIHSGSSWFVHAKTNNNLLKSAKLILEKYWEIEDSLVDYYLFHCALSWSILNCKKCMAEYIAMPRYANIEPHLLQFSLMNNRRAIPELLKLAFCHKLTWKSKIFNRNERDILALLNSC